MHQATLATFSELSTVLWFSRVGNADLENSADFVQSWQGAVASMVNGWEEIRINQINSFEERLRENHPTAWEEWETRSESVKSAVDMVMSVHVEPSLSVMLNDRSSIVKSVYLDLFGLGMECEYSDILDPGFFAGLAFFYWRGHFPCGWRGKQSSEGRLIVY